MRKSYITLAICAMLGTLFTASGAPAAVTVVDEDFSLFTAGSEATPDPTDIADYSVFEVPASYTKIPHWPGGGVYQAGGVCYLGSRVNGYGEPDFGFISTPVMELYGTVTLTFRARLAEEGKGKLWFALCDNDYGPIRYYYPKLTGEWQSFTYTTDEADMENLCNFQFSAQDAPVFIDDIKVTRVRDRIPSPNVDYPRNISTTSFEARWVPTGAPEHLLSVYYKKMPDHVESGVLSENFDGINATADGRKINTANPGYPAGWTIDVSRRGSRDLIRDAGCYLSGPQAIVLDAEGDLIRSAETPLPISTFRFWLRPSRMDQYSYSMIAIRVLREDGSTETLAQYNPNPSYMTADGVMVGFDQEVVGDGARRIEIEYIQNDDDDIAFYVDNVEIEYMTGMERHFVVDHRPVDGESYVVGNIDPQYDHYYFVVARDGELTSEESGHMWVDGITGLKVNALPATGVGPDGFVANWEPLPNASDYNVVLRRVVTAVEDMPGFTLLKEDFSGITKGDITSPLTFYEPQINLAEQDMAQSGWVLTNPVCIKGMAGSFGTTWYGAAGLVATPRISLDNGDGSFSVKCSFYNTVQNDNIWVMLLNDLTDTQAIVGVPLKGGDAGVHSGVAEFPAGSGLGNVIVAFMSESGGAFFIDDVEIVQDLRQGDCVNVPYGIGKSQTDSYWFGGLPVDSDYEYTVSAYRKKHFYPYRSLESDPVSVVLDPASVDAVMDGNVAIRVLSGALEVAATGDACPVCIFDLYGRCVDAAEVSGTQSFPLASGIYIVTAGSRRMKFAVK